MNILLRYILLTGSALIFLIGLIFQDEKVLLVSLLGILAHNILYSFKGFYEKIIFLSFNITFFIFLIGRMLVTAFFGYKSNLLGTFGLAFSEKNVVTSLLSCIYLSLLALYIGYELIQKVNLSFLNQKKNLSLDRIKSIRLFSLVFFYISVSFRFIYDYQMRQTAASEGYYQSFFTFRSSLPSFAETLSSMYDVAFFGYLSTNPNKRKSLFPILLYIGEGLMAALAGRRSIFMLNIIIVFIYFCIRSLPKSNNIIKKEKKWLGKKEWIFGLVSMPVLLAFMTFIGNIRNNFSGAVQKTSFLSSIYEFFYTQGISANLIGYTKIYANQIPKDRFYSIGPIMEFIDNRVIRPLKGIPPYDGQTVDRALNGHLFAHTISYVIMPNLYLMGIGYGSSFVAELYNDFSMLGVFLGSIVYGAILYLFYCILRNSNYILVIFTLMMTRSIMFAPRGAFLSFIVSSFSMSKIAGVLIIIIGSKVLYSLTVEKKILITNKQQ